MSTFKHDNFKKMGKWRDYPLDLDYVRKFPGMAVPPNHPS